MYTQFEYENEGKPVGVSDMFMQVSGLKFTIDTSVNPSIEFDEFGMFKEVEGERRVKNVFVLNRRGSYIPINLNAEYTLASDSLITKEGFGGINVFADNTFVFDDTMPDYQVVLEYLNNHLEGRLGARYSTVEGRINIK